MIGASAGGIIAMHAALRFPDRFASLGLYAATPGINPERPKKGNWLARVAKGGVRNFLTETMHDRIGDASPAHQKWFLDTAEGVTPEYLGRFVPLMASEYFPEKLAAIACPTLMVVPDPDPMVEAHEYERMRKYLKKCRYVSVKGAGHSMVGRNSGSVRRRKRSAFSMTFAPAALYTRMQLKPCIPCAAASLTLIATAGRAVWYP